MTAQGGPGAEEEMSDAALQQIQPDRTRAASLAGRKAAAPRSLQILICLLVLSFLLALRLVDAASDGIVDPDYFWHLKTGEWIWAHGRLPPGDIFSHSLPGAPWNLHEWLFQVLLYLVHAAGGDPLVFLLSALLAAGALTLTATLAARHLGNPLLGLLAALFFLSAYLAFVVPRPHLFSYLFFAWLLKVLWDARYEGRLRGLITIPLLMPLWVNLHGGYFIALAFFFGFVVLEGLRAVTAAPEARPRPLYLKAVCGAAAASLLASFLNPEGPAHLLYPLYVLGQSANQTFIAEWASFNFSEPMARWYLLAVLGFLALFLSRGRRPDLTEMLIPLLTLAAGFLSMRHAPFAVLVMIAYAGQAVGAGALEPVSQRLKRLARRRHSGQDLSPRAESALLSVVSLVLAALLAAVLLLPNGKAEDREFFADGLAFIEQNDLQGPMLNQYGLGGYLIWHLWPERPVYIDGRADLYGDAFIEEYATMVAGEPGWRRLFDAKGFSYRVLKETFALVQLLDMHPDYARGFESEDGFVIHLRRSPAHRNLIEAFEPRPKGE